MADDDEWSIEILDGNCVNAPTKLVKQLTPPTSTAGPRASEDMMNILRSRLVNQTPSNISRVYPSLSHDFSTRTASSGAGLETMERAFDFRQVNRFQQGTIETSYGTSNGDKTRQCGSSTAVNTHNLPNASMQGSQSTLEQHRVQRTYNVTKHHKLPHFKRDALSSFSFQSSSGGKEGESSLPTYSFMEYQNPPTVVYIKSEREADRLVGTLEGPLGFDLEWRVMWQPGAQERRTALVQLCDYRTILLIQVSSMKRFPVRVSEVIESADIVKTGANILNDGEKLYRDFGIRARGLVELGAFATKADGNFSSVYNREIVSLAKMVAMYLGRTLLKGKVRTSNWEASLSQKMVEYAANDCHCALMVYDRLQGIANKSGKKLELAEYSCQVNSRSRKPSNFSLPAPPQRPGGSTMKSFIPDYCIPEPPRPQQLRAYKLWHMDKMPLDEMCVKLRTGSRVEPLKESTVISYVVGALQADPRLPFDMMKLKAFVRMEASSWQRHRQWIASQE